MTDDGHDLLFGAFITPVAADKRGGVYVDGAYYQVKGAKRGPAPAHTIGI